jgi:hypothetical protein
MQVQVQVRVLFHLQHHQVQVLSQLPQWVAVLYHHRAHHISQWASHWLALQLANKPSFSHAPAYFLGQSLVLSQRAWPWELASHWKVLCQELGGAFFCFSRSPRHGLEHVD